MAIVFFPRGRRGSHLSISTVFAERSLLREVHLTGCRQHPNRKLTRSALSAKVTRQRRWAATSFLGHLPIHSAWTQHPLSRGPPSPPSTRFPGPQPRRAEGLLSSRVLSMDKPGVHPQSHRGCQLPWLGSLQAASRDPWDRASMQAE